MTEQPLCGYSPQTPKHGCAPILGSDAVRGAVAGRVPGLVERLMARAAHGELVQQRWFPIVFGPVLGNPNVFQKLREHDATTVIITYALGVALTGVLKFVMRSPAALLGEYAVRIWAGSIYLVLGTKLSHRVLEYGVCLIGVVASSSYVVCAAVLWLGGLVELPPRHAPGRRALDHRRAAG